MNIELGIAYSYPLDLTDIVAIQFQVGTGSPFDIWIDDVRLTPR